MTPNEGDAPAAAATVKTGKPAEPAPPAEATSAKDPGAAAETLRDTVRRVREQYDKQTIWMVTALSAIGVAVYGSLPFSNAIGQDLFPATINSIGGGLLLAGFGIAVVLWARSRTLEPQDASLGELVVTLERFSTTAATPRGSRWWEKAWLRRLRPTVAANYRLHRTLTGPEAVAHVGPGIATGSSSEKVRALISKIGQLEARALELTRDADGDSARRALVRIMVDDLSSLTGPGRSAPPAVMVDPALRLNVSEVRAQTEYDRADVEARLAVYLGHRELLLAESAIAQIRGAFRAGRTVILLGGVITLLGAAIYTANLPAKAGDVAASPPAPGSAVPITVMVRPSTTRIDSSCRGKPLTGFRTSPTRPLTAADRDGPFTVFVVDPPACRTTYEFVDEEADLVQGE